MFHRSDDVQRGWINGFIGMLMFAGSLPATRVAVAAFDPQFLTWARAAIAGIIAMGLLLIRPQRGPGRDDMPSLAVVAGACVVAFPLLTSLALRTMTSADAIVFIGLLPLATATAGQLRGDRRPHPAFWAFAVAGSAMVVAFALSCGAQMQAGGAALMLTAVVLCGFGYAEGARLARRLGGWQVIAWALVLALPLTLPLSNFARPVDWSGIGWGPLAGLAYVSVISMFVGFVFWYDGLARGGTAAVGQLQLLQPFFGLLAAGLVLHEAVGWPAILMLAATLACAAGARHYAGRPAPKRIAAPTSAAACLIVAFAIGMVAPGAVGSGRAASFPERLYDEPSRSQVVPGPSLVTVAPVDHRPLKDHAVRRRGHFKGHRVRN